MCLTDGQVMDGYVTGHERNNKHTYTNLITGERDISYEYLLIHDPVSCPSEIHSVTQTPPPKDIQILETELIEKKKGSMGAGEIESNRGKYDQNMLY